MGIYYIVLFSIAAIISSYMFGYEQGQTDNDVEMNNLREAASMELAARARRKKCQEPLYKPYKPKQ